MKKLVKVLSITVLTLVFLSVCKDQILKYAVATTASHITGVRVHIEGFSFSFLDSSVRISGLKIYNPSEFPEGVLILCSKINAIYDRSALFKKKLHFALVEIEVDEVGITKNKDGELNMDALKVAQETEPIKPIPMQIDLLTLGIGKIIHKDYTDGVEPAVRVQEVNIHKSFKDITSAKQLVVLAIAEPIKAAGIKSAKIYGVSLLAGVAVLPVGIAATFLGKDSVQQTMDASSEYVYKVSLEVVKRMGRLTKDDEAVGVIKGNIQGAMVALHITESSEQRTEITISARKYLFPKPDIAGGVMYQIADRL